MSRGALAAALAACLLSGCFRDQTYNCEGAERYSTARSTQPVQIPDDLSPPDESEALRLPPDPAAMPNRNAVPVPPQGCLESPPPFSRDGPLGRRNAPAEPPSESGEPAADAPSTGADREISN